MRFNLHALDSAQQVVALSLDAASEAAAREVAGSRGLAVFSVATAGRHWQPRLAKKSERSLQVVQNVQHHNGGELGIRNDKSNTTARLQSDCNVSDDEIHVLEIPLDHDRETIVVQVLESELLRHGR